MKITLKKMYKKMLFIRRELIAYYCHHFKQKNPEQVRVVIFAQGRTGSTVLENLISSTGYFQMNGELLDVNKSEVFFPVQFILGLPKRKQDENFIFHVKLYQLTRDRKRPVDPVHFLNTLYNDGWKIIYLKRRNKIKHVLSNMVANERGAYHKFDKKKEDLSLHINFEEFRKWVDQRLRFDQEEKKVLQDVDYHEVIYEEGLEKQETHQKTINEILDYLSLEKRNVSTRYKKVNTRPLEKLISNYDEFEKNVIKQGWGEFLE